jgi:hypothetical protein
MTQHQDLQGRVPESRACAQVFVTLQEWNDQPRTGRVSDCSMSYGSARSGVTLAPILHSTDITRCTMTLLRSQAQNGALRWERLDDLHPLSF